MSFSAFEHSLIDFFKKQSVKKIYTVACSGGLDSVTLFCALKKIQPVFKYDLKLLHIHHGGSSQKPLQTAYRDKALSFVEDLAHTESVDFSFSKAQDFLESEEDCRDFRLQVYCDHENVLTAHHRGDFLETLVLRMIRGAGPQGLREPFKELSLKPFLGLFSQKEIKDYALLKNLNWTEDPSNISNEPLRNWVRNKWLNDLDEKVGSKGFEKSLMLISKAVTGFESAEAEHVIEFQSEKKGFFLLEKWIDLDRFQKQSMVAHILLKVRKTGYTWGQIEEVVKQLDQIKKNTTFRSGKLTWTKSQSKVSFGLDL